MDEYLHLRQERCLKELEQSQPHFIIGCDEVGLGAWAGPATAGVVVARRDWVPSKWVRDSKQLSRAQRDYLVATALEPPSIEEAWVTHIPILGCGSHKELLRGVAAAFKKLIEQAQAAYPNSIVVLDGIEESGGIPTGYCTFPKADALVPACSAASILAKVSRDSLMGSLAREYGDYGWQRNSGYGVPFHISAIRRLGVTQQHRLWIRPIQKLMRERESDGLNPRAT